MQRLRHLSWLGCSGQAASCSYPRGDCSPPLFLSLSAMLIVNTRFVQLTVEHNEPIKFWSTSPRCGKLSNNEFNGATAVSESNNCNQNLAAPVPDIWVPLSPAATKTRVGTDLQLAPTRRAARVEVMRIVGDWLEPSTCDRFAYLGRYPLPKHGFG